MRFTYSIHPGQRVIFQRYEGRFTASDLITATRKMWADPAYRRDYDGIVDASDVSIKIDLHDFHAFAAFLADRKEVSVGCWAAVTTSPLVTACAFLYKAAPAGRHKFQVFSSWEAACDFIKLPQSVDFDSGQPKQSSDLAGI